MKIWQVGSGTGGRKLAPRFIRYGVALIGPGEQGDYQTCSYEDNFVKRFAEEVRPGDYVVLRSGRRTVEAIGIVAESGIAPPLDATHEASPSYLYLEQFGDEDGWDLQHAHRVHWLPIQHHLEADVFGTVPPRFSETHSEEVRRFVEDHIGQVDTSQPWEELPDRKPQLRDEEIATELFDAGLSRRSVDDTCQVIRQIQRLCKWYWDKDEAPGENETLTYMVAPLLLALGWSEQQVAIEWNQMDLVLFRELPRERENCCLVVETKPLGSALRGAVRQARDYVRSKGLTTCKWCLATDGVKYRLVAATEGEDQEEPTTGPYINVSDVRSVDLLMRLMPRALEREQARPYASEGG